MKRIFKLVVAGFLVGLSLTLAACGGGETGSAPTRADFFAEQDAVSYRRAAGNAHTLTSGASTNLAVDDAFATDAQGEARLVFLDCLALRVFANTSLQVDQRDQSIECQTRFSMAKGAIEATKRIGVGSMEIATKWAVIKDLDTTYFVHYDDGREMTWVVVKRGEASVTAAGVEVIVQAGQQTWVEPGKAPIDPILACRDLVGPEGTLFPEIDVLTNGGITDLEWLPCPATPTPTSTPTPLPAPATPTPRPPLQVEKAQPQHPRFPPIVLANYFTWYDLASWNECNIVANDRPLRLYSSHDPETIRQHISAAVDAGLDGFTAQWAQPGDDTDRNFATLLDLSAGTDFRSTVVFLRHIWGSANQENVVDALRYLLDSYAGQRNFLKIDGRPVIFVTDVYRVPTAPNQKPQDAWASILRQVDPEGRVWWIAEGLDPSYLNAFDGLWVYKITHRDYPNDYLKASTWASRVRSWEKQTGKTKLWVGTLMPGWDDRNADCKPDVRAYAPRFVRDRADGQFYRATFTAATGSQPDLLWIHSFNEWVEGTYIEASQSNGDFYLQLTRQFAEQYKQ